jgi:hypothetical protein
MSAKKLINKREKTHGSFSENAKVSQGIKECYHNSVGWPDLPNDAKESLDLIATKISRILSGNHSEKDHWDDIAGYAELIASRLKNEH